MNAIDMAECRRVLDKHRLRRWTLERYQGCHLIITRGGQPRMAIYDLEHWRDPDTNALVDPGKRGYVVNWGATVTDTYKDVTPAKILDMMLTRPPWPLDEAIRVDRRKPLR